MNLSLAMRENNKKRNFLIVNSDLCKHVPSSPGSIKYDLANKLVAKLILEEETLASGHNIIVIGFAETATALGYFVAEGLKALLPYTKVEYTTTTRNREANKEYAEFTESHSHATEQFILKDDILVNSATRFIIVDDEITTGNTAFKLINIIEELNGKDLGNMYNLLAPVVNKQVHLKVKEMLNTWISVCTLKELESSEYDTFKSRVENELKPNGRKEVLERFNYSQDGFWSIELGVCKNRSLLGYEEYINKYSSRIGNNLLANINPNENTLVDFIGCEEYMTLAIKAGMDLQNYTNTTVLTHSITRSPIEPSDDSLLTDRLELPSFYGNYNTYIYNSGIYDKSKYNNIIVALIFPVEMDFRKGNMLSALISYFKSKGADKVIAYTYKLGGEENEIG